MNPRPPSALVWKAIDIYLESAYGAALPLAVKSRVEALRALDEEAFFESEILEQEAASGSARYCLRLGNRFYPHMKMIVETAPGGQGFVFRADCHDRHCCPPEGAPEYTEFLDLMEKNRVLAQGIEAA
ncbi:MAG TPA: hypothetical protein VEY30_05230, partial [Myxococcaceae bacterium]|nr:hypothetical protein [Myxococcaceae bacterium]